MFFEKKKNYFYLFLDYLSLMADQLFQTADKILRHTNGINANDKHFTVTKEDKTDIMIKLEQIIDSGGIFVHQNSKIALNNSQQYLDILVEVIKKRSLLTDI